MSVECSVGYNKVSKNSREREYFFSIVMKTVENSYIMTNV